MKKRTWEGNGQWQLMTLYFSSDDVKMMYSYNDRDSGCGDDFEDRDNNNIVDQPGELQGKRQHWPGLAEERSSEDFPPLMTRVIRVTRDFALKDLQQHDDDDHGDLKIMQKMYLITQTLVTAAIEGPGLVCSGRLSGSNWYYKGEQRIQ